MVDYAFEAKRSSSVKRLTQRARLRFPAAEPGEIIYEGRGIEGVLARGARVPVHGPRGQRDRGGPYRHGQELPRVLHGQAGM